MGLSRVFASISANRTIAFGVASMHEKVQLPRIAKTNWLSIGQLPLCWCRIGHKLGCKNRGSDSVF